MRNNDAIEALIEEYRSRFTKVLQQICMCKHEYEKNKELLRFLGVDNEVTRCIKEKRPCNLGFIEVRINRKFLGSQVIILLDGKEISINELNRLLSSARFFKEWYESDCSVDTYMQPLIGADHYDAIRDFLTNNLDKLQAVCDGGNPSLNFNDLPTYVVNGMIKAVNDMIKKI